MPTRTRDVLKAWLAMWIPTGDRDARKARYAVLANAYHDETKAGLAEHDRMKAQRAAAKDSR